MKPVIDHRGLEEKVVGAAAWTREYMRGVLTLDEERACVVYLEGCRSLAETMQWEKGVKIITEYIDSYKRQEHLRISKYQGVLPLD